MSYAPGASADATEYEASSPHVEHPFEGSEFGEFSEAGEFGEFGEAAEPGEFEEQTFEDSFAGESPFLAGQASGAGEAGFANDMHELLAELYDSEFDRHLLELSEAAAEAAYESPFVQGETGSPEAERYVREWLEPLHREAETMLEGIGESLGDRDLGRIGEFELEELLAAHEPLETGENPVFENFLGGLWKKAKGIVSGAVKLAKKGIAAVGSLLPIGQILGRLKVLIRPLLERVLQMALNRLPPGLRPAAEQLKRRLFGEAGADEVAGVDPAAEYEGHASTTGDIGEVQREFDVSAASLLLAADEAEQDMVVAEAYEATAQDEDPINELNIAREQFVAELQALPPGGDPLPAVQNFIPAVMAAMPLVRLGISLIGRDRIVRFIAQFVAGMIRPYTGDLAPALSQAIASTGLSIMSLEAPVDPRAVAGTVLAGTVEDTVRRVAEEPGEALEHPDLLEATVASAFDEAAAHHFPPSMIKPEHRRVHLGADHRGMHPHHQPGAFPQHHAHQGAHHEHHHGSGMWVRLPQARWYRTYTKVLSARITPTIARQVRVFGGTTLEAFLRDHYGITGEVTAPVHVYEALPGATLGRIAAHEKHTKGLGHPRASWKLQPLTPEVAGLLLGEPGLGRAADAAYLARPEKISVGQRFYYLELHHRRQATVQRSVAGLPAGAVPHAPRPSEVNVRVEPAKHRMTVALHLSEADAQEAAAMVRGGQPTNVAKLLRHRLHDGLQVALSPNPAGHLHWIGAAGPPRVLAHAAAARHLAGRVLGWAGGPVLDAVTHRPHDFTAAAERHAHGLTVLVHLAAVPPLHAPRVHVAHELAPHHRSPVATVEIVPGFRNA